MNKRRKLIVALGASAQPRNVDDGARRPGIRKQYLAALDAPIFGNMSMIARAMTDFPKPDSPTRATHAALAIAGS